MQWARLGLVQQPVRVAMPEGQGPLVRYGSLNTMERDGRKMMTAINRPCCIDISHGNDVSDDPTSLAGLDRVKAQGVFALIHKATESTGFQDQRYAARRAKWMSGGNVTLIDVDGSSISVPPRFGAYHFFHGQDPVAEARYFLSHAALEDGDMPFIDWEAVGASGYQPSIQAADAFCTEVEQALGRPCGVYGGNVPREQFSDPVTHGTVAFVGFQARPLWFCAYGGVRLLEMLPAPWTSVFLWQDDGDQYGPGPHVMPGISGYCDNSTIVNGTFLSLNGDWLRLATPATPTV